MKVAVLFSGGKDSTYALHWAVDNGNEICCLLGVKPLRADSVVHNVPNIDLTEFQAQSMGFQLQKVLGSGEKEQQFQDLKKKLFDLKLAFKIKGVVSSSLASNYHQQRIELICRDLKLKCLNPLWLRNPQMYLEELIRKDYKIVFVGTYAQGFDKRWLGRELDYEALLELLELRKLNGTNIAGEGGEYETFVRKAPLFKKEIIIKEAETTWDGTNGEYLIKKVELR